MSILDDFCAVAIEFYDIYSRSAEAIISSQRPLDLSEAIHRAVRSTSLLNSGLLRHRDMVLASTSNRLASSRVGTVGSCAIMKLLASAHRRGELPHAYLCPHSAARE